jgi:hypothetical protein
LLFESPALKGRGFSGEEEITRYWENFYQGNPDVQFKIEEIFGLGKRCIIRWRSEWLDQAGEKDQVRGADIIKVEDGKICEMFSYTKVRSL